MAQNDSEIREFIVQETIKMVADGIKEGVFMDYSVANKIADEVIAYKDKAVEEAQKELLMNFIEAFNRAGKYDGNNIRIITSSFNLQNFLKIERNNRLKGEKLDE